ncbi:MAG TPA: STAS domain-containing protein [Candidatus Acidoferrum sp.]|nr:STAS domain-containing protein [Candidatus Acidoferrum sp.]
MILKIQEKRAEPAIVILEMAGRICLGRDCMDVEWRMDDLLKRGEKKVIFDLTGIEFVDSTGVGILITCYGRLKKSGGELRLVGVQAKVQELLSMTQVDKVIAAFPTIAAAAEKF